MDTPSVDSSTRRDPTRASPRIYDLTTFPSVSGHPSDIKMNFRGYRTNGAERGECAAILYDIFTGDMLIFY